jgi:hypothetical protein
VSTELLREQAGDFAGILTEVLNGTVTTGARVAVFVLEGTGHAIVAPSRSDPEELDEIGWVPLSIASSAAKRDAATTGLKVRLRVGLDQEGEHLQVETSVFGLCVDRKTGFCPIRLEYDRAKTAKPAAHVQVHGESAGVAYAFAQVGQPLRPLAKLHIPVGHRRFRPTLEDFIEFLAQEKLIPRPKRGWEKVIARTRGGWEVRQVRAAVRRFPDAAVAELRACGYTVDEP